MNTTEAFKVQEPDYALSPYTGMTRKHWIEAGKYLLKGLFDNLDSIDSPPLVPRTENLSAESRTFLNHSYPRQIAFPLLFPAL